jgi:D-amino-acid oxidase
VLGAGVSGLSSAIRLGEAGHRVRILARERPQQTTSVVAGAMWYPYRAAPADRVRAWGAATYRELARISADPSAGVTMVPGMEVFRAKTPDPDWADAVPGFRRATADELPAGFVDGYALTVPVADMSIYLGWLERRAEALGINFETRAVGTLADLRGAADLIVNCTGLGAREVARDALVYGVRGQIQIVDAPAVSSFLLDEGMTTYVIPRGAGVVMGGTAEEGVEDVSIDENTAASIRARCAALVPALGGAPVIVNRAGIRPCRPSVRLEREDVDGQAVIHNYGHGGSGFTISWGCAEEVEHLSTWSTQVPR